MHPTIHIDDYDGEPARRFGPDNAYEIWLTVAAEPPVPEGRVTFAIIAVPTLALARAVASGLREWLTLVDSLRAPDKYACEHGEILLERFSRGNDRVYATCVDCALTVGPIACTVEALARADEGLLPAVREGFPTGIPLAPTP